jgi:hypothetical protein
MATCSQDRLDTNLDLGIKDPSGNWVPNAWSASWDNNYEVVPPDGEIVLSQTGTYQIVVRKASVAAGESATNYFVGIAWTKLPPKAGTYDNASGWVTYDGAWDHVGNQSNAIWSTLSWGYSGNAEFAFNGTAISYFYSMAPNRGTPTVYIDGLQQQPALSAWTQQDIRRQIGRTWTLPSGDHTIRVNRGAGGDLIDVDAFAVDIERVGVGSYDNTHPILRYIGYWFAATGVPGATAGTLHWSDVAGSLFRITFEGDTLRYTYSKAPNRGKAAVTIDGLYRGDIDMYAAVTQRGLVSTYSGLGQGIHIFSVHVTGRNTYPSTGYFVDVDHIEVQP